MEKAEKRRTKNRREEMMRLVGETRLARIMRDVGDKKPGDEICLDVADVNFLIDAIWELRYEKNHP